MRILYGVFVVFIFAMFLMRGACYASIIAGDVYGAVLRIDSDVTIMDDTYVMPDRIELVSAANIENNGIITSDIYVCAGCDFNIRNRADMSGQIYLGDGAVMVQQVDDIRDVTRLDVDGFYTVVFNRVKGLSLGDLYNVGADAGHVVLRDVQIRLDNNPGGFDFNSSLEIDGVLSLVVPGNYKLSEAPILRNISGNGIIRIDAYAVSPMYVYNANVEKFNLYLDLVRETDYIKILKNNLGAALNALRVVRPDDPFLAKLDAARDLDELYHIMSRSFAVRPYMLSGPLRLFDETVINMTGADLQAGNSGFCMRPFALVSDDVIIYAATVGGYFDITNRFKVGGALYLGRTEADITFDDVDVAAHGANVSVAYNGDYLFARATGGATWARFKVPYVFLSDRILDRVHGRSAYGVSDVGININAITGLRISPYVGSEYKYLRILEEGHSHIGMRAGTDVIYSYAGVNTRYEYKIGGVCNTFSEYGIMMGAEMSAIYDGLRLGTNLGIVREGKSGMGFVFSVVGSLGF